MRGPDLELLHQGAMAAGEICLKHYGKSPEVWEKSGGQGPVSQADLEVDQMLTEMFRTARPDYGWLSEETEDDPERLNCDCVFIVDPIDGTRSFINRHENFSNSLAVSVNGEITAAVVHLPVKGMTFEAEKGKGAFLNGEPIRHNGRTEVEGARILASGSQTKLGLWRDAPPPIERHFRSSLAYRMCLVAQGRFDGMLTLRPTWEWDIAGGTLICQEAGVALSTQTGEMPRFNQPEACCNGLIAATPDVHAGLMNYL